MAAAKVTFPSQPTAAGWANAATAAGVSMASLAAHIDGFRRNAEMTCAVQRDLTALLAYQTFDPKLQHLFTCVLCGTTALPGDAQHQPCGCLMHPQCRVTFTGAARCPRHNEPFDDACVVPTSVHLKHSETLAVSQILRAGGGCRPFAELEDQAKVLAAIAALKKDLDTEAELKAPEQQKIQAKIKAGAPAEEIWADATAFAQGAREANTDKAKSRARSVADKLKEDLPTPPTPVPDKRVAASDHYGNDRSPKRSRGGGAPGQFQSKLAPDMQQDELAPEGAQIKKYQVGRMQYPAAPKINGKAVFLARFAPKNGQCMGDGCQYQIHKGRTVMVFKEPGSKIAVCAQCGLGMSSKAAYDKAIEIYEGELAKDAVANDPDGEVDASDYFTGQ